MPLVLDVPRDEMGATVVCKEPGAWAGSASFARGLGAT